MDTLFSVTENTMNAFLPAAPACPTCSGRTIGWGKDRAGNVRRKCKQCGQVHGIIPARPLGRMRISIEKATLCVSLLTEGVVSHQEGTGG